MTESQLIAEGFSSQVAPLPTSGTASLGDPSDIKKSRTPSVSKMIEMFRIPVQLVEDRLIVEGTHEMAEEDLALAEGDLASTAEVLPPE